MGRTKRADNVGATGAPLGQYVYARRMELELSQEAIGAALGTSHTIISQLEKNPAYKLNKRHFAALARILQTDVDTLLEIDGLRSSGPGKPSRLQQDGINLLLRMSDDKARLARSLLRAVLEDDAQSPKARQPEENG